MAVLTVATIVDSGLLRALAAASTSDTFADDGTGRTYIEIANASGGNCTVTIPAQTTSVNAPGVGTLTIADITVTITTATTKLIGPFTRAYINTAGLVTCNLSTASSVTSTAYKLAKED